MLLDSSADSRHKGAASPSAVEAHSCNSKLGQTLRLLVRALHQPPLVLGSSIEGMQLDSQVATSTRLDLVGLYTLTPQHMQLEMYSSQVTWRG